MSNLVSTPASDASRQRIEHHRQKSYRGYLYIAAATFSWGISATLGRAAFTGLGPM